MKKLLFYALTLLAFTSITVLSPFSPSTNAASASDWQAGRIIDDGIFTDATSMSVSDIQAFLNKQVPICDTGGTLPATEFGRPDLTHAEYAASRGWPAPPYICLRDYYEVPKTTPSPDIPANNFSGSIPTGALSAAQLIYNAAQQYNISPKVLLVMIQKESSGPLITDTWPLASQYKYPLGAHCPDSTGCDPNYAGFSIQISESAGLLRWYLDNMNQPWWQYKKVGVNSILYNPNTSCGSSSINITTSATAALYTYTPYQPNAAALANLYGTGDACSSYGNRNFWRIYTDWFGSTTVPISCLGTEQPLSYVIRYYNPKTYMHFYSAYACDATFLKHIGYIEEYGVFNTSPKDSPQAIPVYRYYNPQTHLHMWSTDNLTADQLAASGTGYKIEAGIVFYVANSAIPGLHNIVRLYNPKTYIHLWVADPTPQELDTLAQSAGYTVNDGTVFNTQ